MTSFNDILTLARAGFNAQQIGALMQVNNSVQGTQGSQTTQSAQLTGGAQTGFVSNANQSQMDKLLQSVTGLTQQLQLANIAGSNQPPVETTDDILASIINPPNIAGGGNNA